MKFLSIIFCLLLFININIGQTVWTTQNSGTNKFLTDVFFIDENKGWVTGWTGTILHTSDGGANWINQNAPPVNSYDGIHFADELNGWAVGYAGRIVHTNDGGNTWVIQSSGTTHYLWDVFFVNADTGWAVGGKEYTTTDPIREVLYTSDGGNNWTFQLYVNDKIPLKAVFFVDNNIGYSVGEGKAIIKTADGGNTWTEQMSGTGYHFYDVCFVNPDTGWVVGQDLSLQHYAVIYNTIDGGNNWNLQTLNPNESLQGIDFINKTTGWAVGGANNIGRILFTSDGGNTWVSQSSGSTNPLRRVFFPNESFGWAVGFNGTILKAINGFRLEGQVTYKNTANTPINNTNILLTDTNGSAIDSTLSNTKGEYLFNNPSNGFYYTIPMCTKPWGGVNTTDALAVAKHFVGLMYLYGLNLEAADVNFTGFVNSADALMIQVRYVGSTSFFPAGDWLFENNLLQLQGVNVVNDFYGLCYGDVNGSYVPPLTKQIPSVTFEEQGTIDVHYDEIVNVPITISKANTVAAISLEVLYPEELIQIENVKFGKNSNEEVLFHHNNGILRISWYSIEGVGFDVDDVLLNLMIRLRNDVDNMPDAFKFITGLNCELADSDIQAIEDIRLNIPKLLIMETPFNYYLGHNHPNPVSSITKIDYSLEESGFVHLCIYNMLGKKVMIIVNEDQDKGKYEVNLDASSLIPGSYFYTIDIIGSNSRFNQSRRMVLIR